MKVAVPNALLKLPPVVTERLPVVTEVIFSRLLAPVKWLSVRVTAAVSDTASVSVPAPPS